MTHNTHTNNEFIGKVAIVTGASVVAVDRNEEVMAAGSTSWSTMPPSCSTRRWST